MSIFDYEFWVDAKSREQAETHALFKKVRARYNATLVISSENAETAFNVFTTEAIVDELIALGMYETVPVIVEDMIYFLVADLAAESGLFRTTEAHRNKSLSIDEGVAYRKELRRFEKLLADPDYTLLLLHRFITKVLVDINKHIPADTLHHGGKGAALGFRVAFVELINRAPKLIDKIVLTCLEGDDLDAIDAKILEGLNSRVWNNLLRSSGLTSDEYAKKPDERRITWATNQKHMSHREMVGSYLGGTPFSELLDEAVPFDIPQSYFFEHCHIVGGTGHGKTQFLQALILRNLEDALQGHGSVMVIDGQGDLIKKILRLSYFDPDVEGSLADKLLLVDPNDIDYPCCLNMFDFNHERINGYAAVDRERIYNATIYLYEYFFGALLGAELSSKQDVIFKYLARAMFAIPDATIHTLLDMMENGEAYQPYIDTLDETSRRFFRTQFFNKSFDDTKEQIARRLWGVISNGTINRMFSSKRNKVDIFEAINEGKIILINTAKDLLQPDGSTIVGRFFIALLVQAAVQRQTIPERQRRATFAYIDEIADYIQGDNKIKELLNQARKYKVGIIGAHQNLNQLDTEQRSTFAASTSVKFAGGLSSKDARALAPDMRCNEEFLLEITKTKRHTEFACFVKNMTPSAIRVTVPFGQMETVDRLSSGSYARLIAQNRARYCVSDDDRPTTPQETKTPSGEQGAFGEFELGDPDVI